MAAAPATDRTGAPGLRIEIFLVSLAAIVLEIAYTRVFSFKLYYYFTYLILGIALLGLGSGGVFVAISDRLRAVRPERTVVLGSVLAGLLVPLSYGVVVGVQLNTVDLTAGPGAVSRLGILCLSLFLPFLAVGVVLATILGARPGQVGRLYAADLLGAAVGCALCVPVFASLGPPSAVMLAAGLLGLTGALAARQAPAWRAAGVALAALCALPATLPSLLPDPVTDRIKALSPQQGGDGPTLFTRWSALFRVDVVEGMSPGSFYQVIHDGIMGSIIVHAKDGPRSAAPIDGGIRAAALAPLRSGARVLIIGAAGGHEIVTALRYDMGEIVAVELNPVTVSLLTDHFADYSGRLGDDPRVRLVNAEGRAFIERETESFDLVWFVAPDSYSALNAASSGAFVLSESYLYTVEMIEVALERLGPDGLLCVQFGEVSFDAKPNRTVRYLATAREAMARLGIDDFASHVLVGRAPGIFTTATVLLKREPFAPEQVERFRAATEAIEGGELVHPAPGGGPQAHPVQAVVGLDDDTLARWLDAYPYEVGPVTDDAPFFWHFASFRDALLRPWGEEQLIWDPEDATGERMLMTLLGFAMVFAGVFLLLPLFALRETWSRIPWKANAAVYFASLGLGFMFFEVSLIQRLTLLLGYPTYSLTVTLFSLLVFSGIGSLLTSRLEGPRRPVLVALLVGLTLLAVLYELRLDPLVDLLIGAPLWVRVASVVLSLAPLGLCLGAFMPIGLGTVASLTPHDREYVAWAWAVNGFFSVMSSVLATMLSMSFGFSAVLTLAVVIYGIGVLALIRIEGPPA
ncbi:MAG: hypothetical protein QNK04_24160 [Myxococcota bacterium]|nr:hypothetical protein [Myxococcota bacterium]